MATVKSNSLLKGLSGKFGDIVFRQVNGKTIMCLPPRKRTTLTANQQKHQERFKSATLYARRMMIDPALKDLYEKLAKNMKCPSAYAAAVADFMTKPKIDEITTADTGRKKHVIYISCASKAKTLSAFVTIVSSDGEVIESGEAVCNDAGTDFKYVVKQNNSFLPGTKAEVLVTDLPGNCTEAAVTI